MVFGLMVVMEIETESETEMLMEIETENETEMLVEIAIQCVVEMVICYASEIVVGNVCVKIGHEVRRMDGREMNVLLCLPVIVVNMIENFGGGVIWHVGMCFVVYWHVYREMSTVETLYRV